MLFAGIGWSREEFNVAILDSDGIPLTEQAHYPVGRAAALVRDLLALHRADGELVCVIESTNGLLEGALLEAGLRVHRADPASLPARPGFGSAVAESLARAAVDRLPELTRLAAAVGMLTGRVGEMIRGVEESVPTATALAESGRWRTRTDDPDADKCVALTFDDGPNPPYTGRVLDVLAQYDVPATFFCAGMQAAAYGEEVTRMVASGHAVGNHSWSHPFLPDLSGAELRLQLSTTDEALSAATGKEAARLFRPPYGAYTRGQLSQLAGRQDRSIVLWDVDPTDWAKPGARVIANTVISQARPGSIILMHDGGGDRTQTVEALPAIIEGLFAHGFRLVPVAEPAALHSATPSTDG